MGDEDNRDSTQTKAHFLRNGFDIQPKQFQVTFTRESLDEESRRWGEFRRRTVSFLDVPENGITFLLGKNGSGKTRFISGLIAFANSKAEDFPDIKLICEIPDFESQFEFYDEIEIIKQEKWFLDIGNSPQDESVLTRYCSLSFFDAVFDSFLACQTPSVPSPLNGLSKLELLESFGADDDALEQWKDRIRIFDMQNEEFHPGGYEAKIKFRSSYVLAEHFLDFIIASLSKSYFHLEGWMNRGPQHYDSGREWWTDPVKRNTVYLALKEMAMSATHIRVQSKDNQKEFELLVRRPDSGPICDLLNEFGIEPVSKYPDKTDGFDYSYPFDLLKEVELFGERYISSIPIPFAETFRDQEHGPLPKWNLIDLTVLNLTESREIKVQQLQQEIFSRYCSERKDINSYVVADMAAIEDSLNIVDGSHTKIIYGYDKLNEFVEGVSKTISECEVGIGALRARLTDGGSFIPVIEFRDSEANEWLAMAEASQGQFDVIQLLLTLRLINLRKTSLRILVADEFDKHLHPTAAIKVLESVQHFSKNNQIVTILSTHSLSQYLSPAIVVQPRIFFDRSVDGGIQLMEGSSAEPYVVAEMLGTSNLDAYLLKRLHVMVEGEHEIEIFKDLFKFDTKILEDISVFSSAGTYGFKVSWETLKFLSTPILIVYDKKNDELESAWKQIQRAAADPKNKLHLWNDFRLKKMLNDCLQRMENNRLDGDTELKSLLNLLKRVVDVNDLSSDPRKDSQRIMLHGVEYPDIVDALPVRHFRSSYKSWEEAREINQVNPSEFKRRMHIRIDTIRTCLAKIENHSDPELLKLKEKVQELLIR